MAIICYSTEDTLAYIPECEGDTDKPARFFFHPLSRGEFKKLVSLGGKDNVTDEELEQSDADLWHKKVVRMENVVNSKGEEITPAEAYRVLPYQIVREVILHITRQSTLPEVELKKSRSKSPST